MEKHVQDISHRVNSYQSVVESLRQTSRDLLNERLLESNELEPLQSLQVLVERKQKEARNIGEDLIEDMLLLDKLSNLAPEVRAVRKATIGRIEWMLEDVDAAKARLHTLRRTLDEKVQRSMDNKEHEEDYQATSAENEDEVQSSKQLQPPGTDEGLSQAQLAASAFDTSTQTDQPKREQVKQDMRTLQLPKPTKALWKDMDLSLHLSMHEESGRYLLRAPARNVNQDDVDLYLHRNRPSLTVAGCCLPTLDEEAEMQQHIRTHWLGWGEGSSEQVSQLLAHGARGALEEYRKLGRGTFGHFSETVDIPRDVDTSRIKVVCHDNELLVVLPKVQRTFWRRSFL